jgi:hypothetical protein
MFSHTINNPNNFMIEKKYYAIPFGQRCTSAIACNLSRIRRFSLPFDWTNYLFPNKIEKILENNFEDFISDVHNNNFLNKYDVHLSHFNHDINKGIDEYKRRIDRFNNIINETNIKFYFIYINEDYLYDNNFRKNNFNDNIFNDFLELELFLKKKYINIDFNILYFNFKKYDIPKNSNIINIVLDTNKLYDCEEGSNYEEFRHYCGKILSDLFNSSNNENPEMPGIFE